jgi:hypothetical protein
MSRAPKRRAIALTATLALTGLAGSGVALLSPSSAAAASSPLAFDLQQSALRSSPKKVFAHYMPSMPVSYDNKDAAAPDYWAKNYMSPDGESGQHAAYGGFTRDAPSPRVVQSGDWKLANMQQDVRQAISAGIDGFSVDLLSVSTTSYNWINTKVLMQAAASVDPSFKIMLVPDMTTTVGSKSQADLAKSMADLAADPAAYRLADGRLVVSPFKAELHDAAWWTSFISIMKSTYNTTVAFVPMFLDERPYLASFAPISYGMSVWGNRNPKGNDYTATGTSSPAGRVQAVHDKGLIWMQPVSYQDERPREGIYDEAENTTNLRNTWQLAMVTKSEWVQLVTWNDYAEGSQLAPSVKHGWGALDLNAYFLSKYKTGIAPVIARDTVYLTHRTQPVSAKPSYPQTRLMVLRGSSSPARDTVEALTLLTQPSTVSVTVGSTTTTCQAPVGVGICTVPLGLGKVSAKVVRGGYTTATVASPFTVTNTPTVQDLQYVSVSSGREGSSTPAPMTTTPTTSTTTSTTSTTSTTTSTTSTTSTATSTTTKPPTTTATTSATTTTKPSTTTTKPSTTTTKPSTSATAAMSVPLSVMLAPVADAYVNESAATTNYGTSTSLASRGTAGYQSFLRFALPATPAGMSLLSASLTLRTSDNANAGSTASHEVKLAGNSWDQSTLTWNKRPAGTTTLGAIKAGTAVSTRYSVTLAVSGLAKVAGTHVTLSVSSSGADAMLFWSKDHPTASYRPQLVLTYG